jgi:ABC-type antimicrobial peptide transport system permease subunit
MIRNYILTTLRSFWKNRSHAFINILGLSLGITCSILIFLILQFELSYDTYHSKADRIYRIVTEYPGEETGYNSGSTYPLPPALKNDFAELEQVVLVDANMSSPVITLTRSDGSQDKFKEQGVAFVDPEYFRVFNYEFVEGNESVLATEKTAVISESIAKKYFGDKPAMNQVINFNNQFDVTITGIVKDPPLNTDLPFRILLSSKLGADKRGWDGWGASATGLQCFVLLNTETSAAQFNSKLNGWHLKYFTGEDEDDGKNRIYVLQPLNDLHFNTNYYTFGNRTISKLTLLTLFFIGIVLLITACINFINLNTVLIINRAKEAGIRKVMGSSRSQLVFQFLGETFIITLISLIISTGLAELAILYVTPSLGYQLHFEPISDPVTILFLLMMPIVVTILSGLYPGVSLSRFQPVQALKNKISGAAGDGLMLRRSLIVFQLIISQVLIVCTIISVQQINHFMAQPLGLKTDGIVEFELPENKSEVIKTLRERLLQIPGVEAATMSNTGSTSGSTWSGESEVTLKGEIVKLGANVKFADHNYLKTYQLTLLHGEDLIESDTATRFVVNEAFAKALGFTNTQDVIGLHVNMWGNKSTISGVVKDFNTNSLHQRLRPTIIFCGTGSYQRGSVRIATKDITTAMPKIQDTWEAVYPKFVFESQFLDQTIAQFYDGERKNAYLIGIFAGVAIFIGCIGLFGLVSFMARSKTKEVGIRKTLGASVMQVVALFSKEFIVLVVISFVISAPLAYYFMEGWLENFEYRIHPGVSTFLIGVGVTFVVVLSTVGIKSYNAAIANPVDSLRDE